MQASESLSAGDRIFKCKIFRHKGREIWYNTRHKGIKEDVDQMLEYLEDGLEDLAIAADYHKMPSWEEYVKDAKSRILE